MRVTIDFYITGKAGEDPILSYVTQSFYPSYQKGEVIDLKRDDVIEREKGDGNFEGEYIIKSVRHQYKQRGVIKRGVLVPELSLNTCGIKVYLTKVTEDG